MELLACAHYTVICPSLVRDLVTMVTKCGYLGNEVNERLRSQFLDPWCVETGQIVELSLPLCLTAAVKCPVFYTGGVRGKAKGGGVGGRKG